MDTRFVNIDEGHELRLEIDDGNDIRIMVGIDVILKIV